MSDEILDGDVGVALLEHFIPAVATRTAAPLRGPALGALVFESAYGPSALRVLLHDSAASGFNNRIVIIADELQHMLRPVAADRLNE